MSDETQEPSHRSEGTTASERYLVRLASHSFLSMWSYANPYTDEGRSKAKGDGKELCDLLVVFGNDIFIFSDKHCEFQVGPSIELAWARWYRRAVEKSVRQVLGARSWIRRFPNRIFIDKACEERFPLPIPHAQDAKFHLIAVTRGAYEACSAFFNGQSTGSLMINTGIVGDMHQQNPFTIGHVRGDGTFVHVFDELTLNVVLSELDTIRDLVDYFTCKEKFLCCPNRVVMATGEEQLVAMYLAHIDSDKRHGFFEVPDNITSVYVEEGRWEDFICRPEYLAKKKADKVSYAWDSLIEHLISEGGSGFQEDRKRDLATIEPALRVLASEPRLARRKLADQLLDALSKDVPAGSRFLRVGYSKDTDETVYVFLVLPKPPFINSYIEYREVRSAMLLACCKVARLRVKTARRIIGLATEPKGNRGSSEDLAFLDFEVNPWDADMENEARILQDRLGILVDGQANYYERHDDEYPKST